MKIGWWNRSGLVSAARAGRVEMEKRGARGIIFDVPGEGVTIVVVAHGERATQLRRWFASTLTPIKDADAVAEPPLGHVLGDVICGSPRADRACESEASGKPCWCRR